ncbi:MAG: flagellar basal body-associated FliL family protein [Oligoflexia bacterium]|nr:flagellar basal body-associated FliL family protein [Oligoflexia bacterium]
MAEKKEEGEEKKEGEAEAKPKGKGKLIIIIAVVVLLLGGGGAAFFLMGSKAEPADAEHAEENHDEEQKHLVTADLEPIIVNLSETSNFLKVSLLLEMDNSILEKAAGEHAAGGEGGGEGESKSGLPGPLGPRTPMIRDAVIKVLSSKKAADVLTIEGKEQIKEELIEAMNEASGLEEGPIVAVYFSDFIVQ